MAVTTNEGRQSKWTLARSWLTFALGAMILAHEVLIHKGAERPYILLAALSLCGVASFLKLDDVLKQAGIRISINRGEDKATTGEAPDGQAAPGPGPRPGP